MTEESNLEDVLRRRRRLPRDELDQARPRWVPSLTTAGTAPSRRRSSSGNARSSARRSTLQHHPPAAGRPAALPADQSRSPCDTSPTTEQPSPSHVAATAATVAGGSGACRRTRRQRRAAKAAEQSAAASTGKELGLPRRPVTGGGTRPSSTARHAPRALRPHGRDGCRSSAATSSSRRRDGTVKDSHWNRGKGSPPASTSATVTRPPRPPRLVAAPATGSTRAPRPCRLRERGHPAPGVAGDDDRHPREPDPEPPEDLGRRPHRPGHRGGRDHRGGHRQHASTRQRHPEHDPAPPRLQAERLARQLHHRPQRRHHRQRHRGHRHRRRLRRRLHAGHQAKPPPPTPSGAPRRRSPTTRPPTTGPASGTPASAPAAGSTTATPTTTRSGTAPR